MDKLLGQEEILINPAGEGMKFDVTSATKFIEKHPFPLQHPEIPSLWLNFLDDETRQQTKSRLEDPTAERRLPYVLLYTVTEEEISINMFCGSDYEELASGFLRWILSNYDVVVMNESGTNLTSVARDVRSKLTGK